jgi:hypothetical protein
MAAPAESFSPGCGLPNDQQHLSPDPNDMSSQQANDDAARRLIGVMLRRVRAQMRGHAAVLGTFICLVSSGGLLLALALTDLFAPFETSARVIASGLLAGLAGLAAICLVVWPLLRPLTKRRVAAQIEGARSGLEERLLTLIDVEGKPIPSEAFRSRLVAEVWGELSRFQPWQAVRHRSLRYWCLGLGLLGVLWMTAELATGRLSTAVERLLQPFADIPPASGNRYVVLQPAANARVLRDEVILFQVAMTRGSADALELELWSGDSAKRIRHDMTRKSRGRWEISLDSGGLGPGFEHYFNYRVRGAGTWTLPQQILIVDRPRIVEVRTNIKYPAYLALADSALSPPDTIDAAAPLGSQVLFHVRSLGEVEGGEIACFPIAAENDRRLAGTPVRRMPLRRERQGHWMGCLTLKESCLYRIELRDRLGHANVPMQPGRLDALLDQPPRVAFERPGTDLSVHSLINVPMVIAAEDDYGLAEVSLAWQRDALSPWQRVTLKQYKESVAEDTIVTSLDLRTIGLVSDQTFRYRAIARDRKGQIGVSRDSSIWLVQDTPAADRALTSWQKEQELARSQLKKLAADQMNLRQSLEKLGASRDARAEEKKQVDRVADLARQASQLAQRLNAALARQALEASKQPLLAEPLPSALQALADQFAKSGLKPLQKQADLLEEKALRGQRPGTDLQKYAAAIEAELRRLEQEMERLGEAQRQLARQPAATVAQLRQQAMRERAAATSAELERLRRALSKIAAQLEQTRQSQEQLQAATHRSPDNALGAMEGQQAGLDPRITKALQEAANLQGLSPPPSANPTGADRRQKLNAHQTDQVNRLTSSHQRLGEEEKRIERLLAQLKQAMKQSSSSNGQSGFRGQGDASLENLLGSKAVAQAMAMAGRARGQLRGDGRGQSSAGDNSSLGNLEGAPGVASAVDPALGRMDWNMRAVLLRLPPRLRGELLQGMREEGPEPYRPLIDEYFRRLAKAQQKIDSH